MGEFIAADRKDVLAVMEEENPQIKSGVVKLRRLSADEQTRDLFERHEKARRDMESRERWARQEGRQEGLQVGRQEGREMGRQEGLQEGRREARQEGENSKAIDTARIMMADKEPIEKIIRYTGLTRNEVEAACQLE